MFCYSIFGTGKIFIDQSSSLSSEQLTQNAVKILELFTLACALVWGSAYKNDNMCEMMLPKIFQPVESFNQLLDSRCIVYTFPYPVSVVNVRNKIFNGTLKT